jgi:RHS repeat-associated protein
MQNLLPSLFGEGLGMGLQNDYKYNIRGWLTAINDPTLSTSEGDKFGLKIGYNKLPDGTTTGLWNGNISGTKWSTWSYLNREYYYTYDGVNRLLSALFKESGVGNAKNNSNYSYDKNGNFNTSLQFGNNSVPIDQLTYGYEANSNQLKYVIDYMGDAVGVEDFPGTIINDLKHFYYDANGNLIHDDYRNINIGYNRFNLPFLMDFGTNQKVSYIYNGSGQKLFREVANGTNPTIHTDYIGMFVHENTVTTASSLKYIITPEGKIINSGTDVAPIWNWEYNLTDHLGNVRAVIAPKANVGYANVVQETSYFPFGMVMSGISSFTSKNKYLYNGKEIQSDFGLNWYDYGARFYDPALGRWHTPDPLAEKYYAWSPYSYGLDKPISNVDVGGQFVFKDAAHRTQLTLLLQNISRVLDNQNIMSNLQKFSGLSAKTIREQFQINSGPEIVEREMYGNYHGFTPRQLHGKVIQLATLDISTLENSIKDRRNLSEYNTALALVLLTILHEYTHSGDLQVNGIQSDADQPLDNCLGSQFEKQTFGVLSKSVEDINKYFSQNEKDKKEDKEQEKNRNDFMNIIKSLPIGNYKVVNGQIVRTN